jgi:hypothetical protein
LRVSGSTVFEIAGVLVFLDHVASVIVNADYSIRVNDCCALRG